MNIAAKAFLISLGCLSMSACSGKQLLNFSVIQQSGHCHFQTPQIHSLASQKEQTQFIERFSAFKSADTQAKLSALFNTHSQAETLFVIAQGRKSSAGYGFQIQNTQGTLENNQLSLPINFTKPAKGSFSAHVMTSPCLVLGIDSSAKYQTLVVDELELHLSK